MLAAAMAVVTRRAAGWTGWTGWTGWSPCLAGSAQRVPSLVRWLVCVGAHDPPAAVLVASRGMGCVPTATNRSVRARGDPDDCRSQSPSRPRSTRHHDCRCVTPAHTRPRGPRSRPGLPALAAAPSPVGRPVRPCWVGRATPIVDRDAAHHHTSSNAEPQGARKPSAAAAEWYCACLPAVLQRVATRERQRRRRHLKDGDQNPQPSRAIACVAEIRTQRNQLIRLA